MNNQADEDKAILLGARDKQAQRNAAVRRFNQLTDHTPCNQWTLDDVNFMQQFMGDNANELFYGGKG
jgi:hypothetical protein